MQAVAIASLDQFPKLRSVLRVKKPAQLGAKRSASLPAQKSRGIELPHGVQPATNAAEIDQTSANSLAPVLSEIASEREPAPFGYLVIGVECGLFLIEQVTPWMCIFLILLVILY
jgi:hypothetical protein